MEEVGPLKHLLEARNPLTCTLTDMKKLLGSGRPPIEALPAEGAGADLNPDIETDSISRGKGNGRGKSLKNGGRGVGKRAAGV